MIQVGKGLDGKVALWEIWKQPIGETLDFVADIAQRRVIAFNLTFDWFQIQKLHAVFSAVVKRYSDARHWTPEEHIEEIVACEEEAKDGDCIKPAGALCLLLHSRKGKYQSLMARKPIRIRRVPRCLAVELVHELETRVSFDDIYFARFKDHSGPRWKVLERKDSDGVIDPDFVDVELKFNPHGGLKFLVRHACGYEPPFQFDDIGLDKKWSPYELGYAPTAMGATDGNKHGDWSVRLRDKKTKKIKTRYAWPALICKHIEHWTADENARAYAADDIHMLRMLDEHFEYPEFSDDDSELAPMVASNRWHGFPLDLDGLAKYRDNAQQFVDASPINTNKPIEVRKYIEEMMDETELTVDNKLTKTTNKTVLEEITKWTIEETEECGKCEGAGCARCGGTGGLSADGENTDRCGNHPAARRARQILDVKESAKAVNICEKLIRAGRFHPSFEVIGTLSNRMSGRGSDGLNPQGIQSIEEFRKLFLTLDDDNYVLCGGDFDAYEVAIADGFMHDPQLREDLTSGRKVHAIFGTWLFPPHTYEEILATSKTSNDLYKRGKGGFFATVLYLGTWQTLVARQGVEDEVAKATMEKVNQRYTTVQQRRKLIESRFCPVHQRPDRKIEWRDPDDYIESFLGFKRRFTLENATAKALFDLGQNIPTKWHELNVTVTRDTRNEREQTAAGAVSSALFGCMYGLLNANVRAAANHEVQSPGGQITKRLQRRQWDKQPCGVHPFVVMPLNIHDELKTVCHRDYVTLVADATREAIEDYREQVPMIEMTWEIGLRNWIEKDHIYKPIHISPRPQANESDN